MKILMKENLQMRWSLNSGFLFSLVFAFCFCIMANDVQAQFYNETDPALQEELNNLVNAEIEFLESELLDYPGSAKVESNEVLIQYYNIVLEVFEGNHLEVQDAFKLTLELLAPKNGAVPTKLQQNLFKDEFNPKLSSQPQGGGPYTWGYDKALPVLKDAVDAIHLLNNNGIATVGNLRNLFRSNK